MLPGIGAAAGLMAAADATAAVNPVGIENETIAKIATSGATATASFTFRTDRTVKDQDGNTIDPKWLDAGYSAADYQIRVTKLSGSTPSGSSLGTWLNLSTNRMWSLSQSGGAGGSATCTLKVEIRDGAAPNTIRDSATYTLSADSQGSAGGGTDPGSVDWDNITGLGTGTISGSNANQTMPGAGTLTFSKGDFGGTYTVFKNGAAQGQVAALSVAAGDLVHFSASSEPGAGQTDEGLFTIGGLVADTFTISFRDTTPV